MKQHVAAGHRFDRERIGLYINKMALSCVKYTFIEEPVVPRGKAPN